MTAHKVHSAFHCHIIVYSYNFIAPLVTVQQLDLIAFDAKNRSHQLTDSYVSSSVASWLANTYVDGVTIELSHCVTL